jgi:hypothetical protein
MLSWHHASCVCVDSELLTRVGYPRMSAMWNDFFRDWNSPASGNYLKVRSSVTWAIGFVVFMNLAMNTGSRCTGQGSLSNRVCLSVVATHYCCQLLWSLLPL